MGIASSLEHLLQRQNVRAKGPFLGLAGSSPSWSLQGGLPTASHERCYLVTALSLGELWSPKTG